MVDPWDAQDDWIDCSCNKVIEFDLDIRTFAAIY